MPVVTRSRSKRSKKKEEEPSAGEDASQAQEKKTPRRSARIAAQKRSQSREVAGSSDEGRQTSMTPVSDPTKKPFFSGISLGHDSLETPIHLLAPEHEAESQHSIRQSIRQFTESPVTLKQTKDKHNNKIYDNNDNNDNDNEDNDNSDENDNNNNNKNDSTIAKLVDSLLSPNRNMQFTSKPSRVPTFNQNTQSWSFAPEQEMPQVARNLLIFIFSLIIIVLAVIYKEELFAAFDTYMPQSFSDSLTKMNDFAMDIYKYLEDLFTNLFSNLFSSNDDSSSTTEQASTDKLVNETM